MAPPRKHDTDTILDAARALVLAEGPRAASVAAIAQRSGAPVGTLYHRFGNRDGVLAAAWLRALERFQVRALEAYTGRSGDPVDAAVAMAGAALSFAVEQPGDVRLLLAVRRSDLLDGLEHEGVHQKLSALNEPLEAAIRGLARELHGRADARAVENVTRAVVDLPMAALRRNLSEDRPLAGWLAQDLEAAVRTLLAGSASGRAHRS